ncbi:MAG: TRAP transporter substrate-binding protein [Desulfitobacteriaceae bacterium]
MGRKLLLGFLILVLVGAGGCGPRVVDRQQVAKNEKIVIKFSHVVAENTPKGLAAKRFADLVRERTGGYVEVQVFPDSQLYKDGEEFDALKSGAVQIIAPATSKLSGMFPEWQLLDLPYAFSNLASVHTFMDGSVGKELFAQLKREKILGLTMWDNGFKQMTNNKHPLILPVDFKGLHFRVMSSKVLQDQFATLGATAMPMAFSDVHEALKSGGVDGEENTVSNIFTQRFDQVQKYITISNHGYIGYVVLTNMDFWASLPAPVRKVLEDTLAEVTLWEREKAQEVNDNQLAALEKEGKIQIKRLSPAEQKSWQGAMSPVYDKLAREIGPDLIDTVKKQQ